MYVCANAWRHSKTIILRAHLGHWAYADFRGHGCFHIFEHHRYITVANQRQEENISFQVVHGINFQLWNFQIEAKCVGFEVQTGTPDGGVRRTLNVKFLEATAKGEGARPSGNMHRFNSERIEWLHAYLGDACGNRL